MDQLLLETIAYTTHAHKPEKLLIVFSTGGCGMAVRMYDGFIHTVNTTKLQWVSVPSSVTIAVNRLA